MTEEAAMMEDLKPEGGDDYVPQAFGVGPIPKFLAMREMGLLGKRPMTYLPPKGPSFDDVMCQGEEEPENVEISPGVKGGLHQASVNRQADEVGEERLVLKHLETLLCKLNGSHTRSTFLMVFSPDKELLASTHGDHNIYITEIKTGKCMQTLTGHPRTPWCIAFHPRKKNLLASGCLGGLVRIWDIDGGGSEVWRTDGVIASLTFHPFDNLLVVATFNELHFWDWSAGSTPFAKVGTKSDKEKVRYVKFDSTGHTLITGIANLPTPRGSTNGTTSSATTSTSASAMNSDRVIWNRSARHAAVAAEHLYGTNLNLTRNSAYASLSSLPRYGRYRLPSTSYSPVSSGSARTTDRGTDPMLSSTSVSAMSSARTTPAMANGRQGLLRRSSHSASQTLSDLAAAASNQLMVENAAAAAASSNSYSNIFDRWSARVSAASANQAASAASNGTSRDLNGDPPFSHSPQSSFREDEDDLSRSSRNLANLDDHSERLVYLQRRRLDGSHSALQARLQAASDDRLRELGVQDLLDRRASLVNQIEELRTARDILTSQNGPPSGLAGGRGHTATTANEESRRLRSSGMSPTLPTTDPLYEPPMRPIEEWAVNRRLSLERSQLSETVDALRFNGPAVAGAGGVGSTPSGSNSADHVRNSNVRATMLIDYLDRDPVLRSATRPEYMAGLGSSQESSQPAPPAPANLVEPEVTAEPESLSSDRRNRAQTRGPQNRDPFLEDIDMADIGDHADRSTPGSRRPGSNLLSNHNMDIVLLSRHIAHMQRICRASLQDCTRQRRQVVRLQSIRKMLEDLQRQIRSLRAASLEELQRRNSSSTTRSTGAASSAATTSTATSTGNEDSSATGSNGAQARSTEGNPTPSTSSSDNVIRNSPGNPGNLLDDRNYDERVGEGEHLAQLRNNSVFISSTLSRLNRASSIASSVSRRTGAPSCTLRSSRSPSYLFRAHSRFLSQMRATVRAIQMSPDLARSGSSPINLNSAEVSRNIMESLQPVASTSSSQPTASTSAAATASSSSTANAVITPSTSTGSASASPLLSGGSGSNNIRGEWRALSQRLENEIRTRRETEASDETPFETVGLHNDDFSRLTDDSLDHGWSMSPSPRLSSESETDSESDRNAPHLLSSASSTLAPFNRDLGRSSRFLSRMSRFRDPMDSSSLGDAAFATPSGSRRSAMSRNLASLSDRFKLRGLQESAERAREERRERLRREILHRRRRWFRLMEGPNYSGSYRYTFHRNYPHLSQFDQPEGDEDDDVMVPPPARSIPRPRIRVDVIPVDDDDDISATDVRPDGTGNNERLPPLRELIWRRLRRRNAQLNMLDEELTNSGAATEPGLREERSSRHRELLSWMVDQMRLDHASPSASATPTTLEPTADATVSVDQAARTALLTPDSPPRFTIRMRRNIEASNAAAATDGVNAADGATAGSSVHIDQPPPTVPRVILPFQVPPRFHNLYNPREQHYFLNSTSTSMLLTHRIQAWDFTHGDLPDISDETANIIVREAKIHNDASVDISEDGCLLVTLVPSNVPMTTVVGVYGLQSDSNRGRCFATYNLESSAVSVSLSPTSRHLLVGLAVRTGRISVSPADRSLMAQIFRIKLPWERSAAIGRLVHRRDLHQTNEQIQWSLNCIRWIPVAGQGIVYATNTGLLKILR